jgi:hypothetical protein
MAQPPATATRRRHLAGKHGPFSQPGRQRGMEQGSTVGGIILAAHQGEQDRRQVEYPPCSRRA